jgi:hypothetical protein
MTPWKAMQLFGVRRQGQLRRGGMGETGVQDVRGKVRELVWKRGMRQSGL